MLTHKEASALAPTLLIAVFEWAFRLFALNRYSNLRLVTRAEVVSLLLLLVGSGNAMLSTMAVQKENGLVLQILISINRSFLSWAALILLINEQPAFTWQQLISLGAMVMTAIMWEIHGRLLNGC